MAEHQGFTIWFTGMSGTGKSTLTGYLEKEFRRRNFKVEVLDGDEVREHLSKGLTFSKEDRDTNVRRIGWLCSLLSRNGVITIAAAISPYEAVRQECRALIEKDGSAFFEIYTRAPLETLATRDVKGLYKRALAGEIPNFTGVSDPYEAPQNPDVTVDSSQENVEDSVARILSLLEERGLISAA
jgi:adenylyl-sulfate kinase